MIDKGGKRVVIENVKPEIDGGRYSIKRVVGEAVRVQADVFADGHDLVSARLLYRSASHKDWKEVLMWLLENDRWEGEFVVEEIGLYYYTIEGWADHFKSWRRDLIKKADAHQDISVDILTGIAHLEAAVKRVPKDSKRGLEGFIDRIKRAEDTEKAVSIALSKELADLMDSYPDRTLATVYERELSVIVDRVQAVFSTWYERFVRSCAPEPNRHGTFNDLEALLPEISRMGFDVLYLPPIHPIGRTNRKGKNNSPYAGPDDPGSPWAIGSQEGGHKAIHPLLGTFEDLEHLIHKASGYGIEIALDLAFQCSPDHPYVVEHTEWFRLRPDGTVQYAENPPKKYEDIYPLNFETPQWRPLWEELRSVVLFWVDKGIRMFRVDNPHTKPFPFWEWLIKEVKALHPDVIFLSEAFTRPKVMLLLAKLGFTQSYTYFTWRNTKRELIDYLTELTQTEIREYFRPNFWPNTPDILPEFLQYGGRAAFIIKLVLAATLSSSYGIYGPAFELCVSKAMAGKEEYLDSEKYEIRQWDWDQPGNLKDLIARVNKIRRENPALQMTWNLRFYEVDNDFLLFYAKATKDLSNIMLVVVNLDSYHTQSGWVRVPLDELGLDPNQPYLAHDLLSDEKYIWQGERNYVALDPHVIPAHLFRIRRTLRRETDFDYYW